MYKIIYYLSISALLVICFAQDDNSESYSFYRFSGPVSGQVREIRVPSPEDHNGVAVDYVAKPDYSYNYEVQDPVIGNQQRRSESRDGDSVIGEYSFLQPDGKTQIVKYTADSDGFKAVVDFV